MLSMYEMCGWKGLERCVMHFYMSLMKKKYPAYKGVVIWCYVFRYLRRTRGFYPAVR